MNMPKWPRTVASAAIIMSGLLLGATPFASAVSTGGIGGRPANPDPNNPRTQSIFIYTLDKGQSKADQVLVSNNSDTTQTIDLYAVDGIVTNTGAYTCQQQAEANTGLGSWIKLAQTQVTLGAHDNQKVDFTITAPSTADVGEHDGCLVFQSASDQGELKGNVRIRTRQAIRVVATIPGKLHRSIAITSFAVTQKNGAQQFTLNLQNTGNVSADVDAEVTLKNIFGGVVYKNGGGYPVLSNKQLSLNFSNEKQPFFGGWYTAQASAAYDNRAGTFGTSDQSHLTIEHAKNKVLFIAPQPLADLLYLIILLLIAGLVVWATRRQAVRRQAKMTWQPTIIKPRDTVESLAASRGVSWKKVAAINDLRAPYTLVPGTKILLPHKATESRKDIASSEKE